MSRPDDVPKLAPKLAAMQARFAAALWQDADTVPAEVNSHNAPRPLKRFHVYRNNVFASLVAVLRGRFPAVERLVGEAFFRAMARIFVEQHPPHSPALFEYGADFPTFLAGFEPARELPYLPDVARLEWLRNEAYHAADAVPAGAEALAAAAADDPAGLRFRLHPSARLLRSDWPAVSIWDANRDDAAPATLGNELGPEDALILRPHLEVLVLRLGPGGFAFAQNLAEGVPLGEAAERAAADDAAFSLPAVLGALLAAGAFAEILPTPQTGSATP
jgi:hypothetical protein